MKRILVFGLSESIGGTENYILTLYKSLDHSKIQFDFLYHYKTGKIIYEDVILSNGGKIYKNYYYNREKKIVSDDLEAFIKKHKEWDGIYINTQTINSSYRLLVIAKKYGLKYRIYHAHNNNYPHKPSVKDKIYEVFFHLTKKRYVTHFCACSELAGKWAFKQDDFIVVPNAVNFKKYLFDIERRQTLREKYKISEDTSVLGFCGRLCYQKNIMYLLEIFREYHLMNSNSKLLLVGDGDLRQEVDIFIEENGLREEVICTGFVDNVNDYMNAMDCFILPSRFEGFGIVLLEAQASGLQCFASDSVIPKETNVSDHVHFIGLEETPSSWATQIIKMNLDRHDSIKKLESSKYSIDYTRDLIMNIFS